MIKLDLDKITEASRLFFVVDSEEHNAELFDTYGEALKYYETLQEPEESGRNTKPRIRITVVNNAHYNEEVGQWEYQSLSDTFQEVGTICLEHIDN